MYDEFYGLSGRPFQLAPDPAFYFESVTHRKALSYLSYGLAQGEGFIVITGEIGAGKSTLAAHLTASVDPERLTVAQIVTSKLDAGELIHVAANAFGLVVPGKDKASALAAIEAHLQDEARAGRRVLLMVDEAQNLSVAAIEELRMLSNLQLGAHPLLQILLLGQPEFRDLLDRSPELEQLRQRVIATHHLSAMEPGETGPYIEHRLSRVGWTGANPAFDQRVYSELAGATGGVPRRINQVVNRLLLLGSVEQRSRIDATMLKAVLAELGQDQPVAAKPAVAEAVVADPVAADPANGQASVTQLFSETAAQTVGPDLMQALRQRDEQIAELQQAVIELADMRAATGRAADPEYLTALADANVRVATLEGQISEQEQTLRHVLTMLIEWFETSDQRRAA
jgi:general secretion pathway protein A